MFGVFFPFFWVRPPLLASERHRESEWAAVWSTTTCLKLWWNQPLCNASCEIKSGLVLCVIQTHLTQISSPSNPELEGCSPVFMTWLSNPFSNLGMWRYLQFTNHQGEAHCFSKSARRINGRCREFTLSHERAVCSDLTCTPESVLPMAVQASPW